jgi:hypothetical protein
MMPMDTELTGPGWRACVIGGEWDPEDDNLDVEVHLDDGRRFCPTFFTPRNLQTLLDGHRASGEFPAGRYFFASDLIVIERLTREAIREALEALVQSGEIAEACRELGPAEE